MHQYQVRTAQTRVFVFDPRHFLHGYGTIHLTSESEEAKECNLVDRLFGVVNLLKETKVGITFDGVVPVGNHTCESVTDVSTRDNGYSFLHIPC